MNHCKRILGLALASVFPAGATAGAVAGPALPQALAAEGVRPLSLASADFDNDGVADLAAGFARPDGSGVAVLYRGNVDALYPNTPEARQRRAQGRDVDTPFLSTDRVLTLPAPPDFLFAGDFDADGNSDLVAAAAGGRSIQILFGDGAGGFGETRAIGLSGALTALASGDVGRRDGLPDLVAGVDDGGAPRALVLRSAEGALRGIPETAALEEPAESITIDSAAGRARIELLLASGERRLLE